jgi:hypothetical protein
LLFWAMSSIPTNINSRNIVVYFIISVELKSDLIYNAFL